MTDWNKVSKTDKAARRRVRLGYTQPSENRQAHRQFSPAGDGGASGQMMKAWPYDRLFRKEEIEYLFYSEEFDPGSG